MDFGNYALVMDIIISMQHLKSCECVVVNTSVMKTSSIGDLYTEISSSFLITCELSRSTFISQRAKNLAWQVVTWRPAKNCQNWRVGNWVGMGPCPGQYGICMYVHLYKGNTHLRFLLQYLTTVHHFQDYFLVYIMYRYMTKTCDLGFKVSWSMELLLTHSSPYKMC